MTTTLWILLVALVPASGLFAYWLGYQAGKDRWKS
jgi:hypothetical protein